MVRRDSLRTRYREIREYPRTVQKRWWLVKYPGARIAPSRRHCCARPTTHAMTAAAVSLLADALQGVALSDSAPVDDPATTESESDWSDAELREADSPGRRASRRGAGIRSAVGARLPREAQASRGQGARGADAVPGRRRRRGRRRGGIRRVPRRLGRVSRHPRALAPLPVDRARVAACRRSERAALRISGLRAHHPDAVRTPPPRSARHSARPGRPRFPRRARASVGKSAAAPTAARSALSAPAPSTTTPPAPLADAAWREVDLRGAATRAALATLRSVACGALRRLDVTGSRGLRRGEILELARAGWTIRTLRAASLGDKTANSPRAIANSSSPRVPPWRRSSATSASARRR